VSTNAGRNFSSTIGLIALLPQWTVLQLPVVHWYSPMTTRWARRPSAALGRPSAGAAFGGNLSLIELPLRVVWRPITATHDNA
jgi:hypothetical protein